MRQPKPYFRKQKRCWYVQIAGRQLSLGRDESQAWLRYHELMAEKQSFDAETVTVEVLLEHYMDWVQENRKPGTYDRVRHRLFHFVRHVGRTKQAAKVTGADLSAWVESEKAWGPTTRNDGIGCVVRAYNWAVGKKYLSRNYVAIVPDKPRRKRRETVLSPEEWVELRSHVKDQAFGDLIDFMWETGCRPIEARTLEARHIDLDAGLAIFPATESKGERDPRVIYLTEKSLAICKRLVEKSPTGPIMRNTKGKPWTKDSINCRFRRLKKKTGKRVFAYALRHSYATNGLKEGTDAIVLSELMGHRDTTMLAKTYAHLAKDSDFLKAQAERLSKSTKNS